MNFVGIDLHKTSSQIWVIIHFTQDRWFLVVHQPKKLWDCRLGD
jgi:hypothetical protein